MMKKMMLCLFSCVLLAVTMVACGTGEPQSAQELYDRIDAQMRALESFRTDMSIDLTLFVEGNEVKSKVTGYTVENGNLEGSYYFCEDITTKMTCEALSLEETQNAFEAYYNGNYFIASGKNNQTVQKLYSPMTVEDVQAYREDNDLDTVDLVKDCTTKNFVKREDGTWELSCSGYTKVAIEKISETIGIDDDAAFADVMDIEVMIVADANYRATHLEMDFVFEESKNAPTISCVMDYSQYNEAEAVQLDYLNVKKFTEVDDIRVLRDIEDMIGARIEAESGEFKLDVRQTVSDRYGKQLSFYMEDNSVSYGEGDDGYFYDIDAVINEERYYISYKNGRQSVIENDDDPQSVVQTEKEARAWIESLIDIAAYSPTAVTYMEDKGNGVYELTCDPSQKEPYESYFKNSGGRLTAIEQTVTVIVKDGQLSGVSSTVKAEGMTSYSTVILEHSQNLAFQ